MFEYWVGYYQGFVEENLFGHDVFLPDLVKVFAVKHGHLRLDLREEPGFQRVEKFASLLQIIQDVALLEFSTSLRQENVLLVILHDQVARDDDVHLVRPEK